MTEQSDRLYLDGKRYELEELEIDVAQQEERDIETDEIIQERVLVISAISEDSGD